MRQAIVAAFDPRPWNTRVYSRQGPDRARTVPEELPVGSGCRRPDVRPRKGEVARHPSEGRRLERLRPSAVHQLGGRRECCHRPRRNAEGRRYQRHRRHVEGLDGAAGDRHRAKDFDLARWGTSIGPTTARSGSLAQNAPDVGDRQQPSSASRALQVDQAVKDLRAAKDDDAKKAAYKIIAEEFNAQVPWINFSAVETLKAFSPKVHGVRAATVSTCTSTRRGWRSSRLSLCSRPPRPVRGGREQPTSPRGRGHSAQQAARR